MRVTLVYRAVESLGLENLSAVLRREGHEVSLVFEPDLFGDDHYFPVPALHRRLSDPVRTAREIAATRPDLVGFSVPTPYYRWALEVARHVEAPVVFGGNHPTSVPERVLAEDAVDHVLTGECDESFARLVAGEDPRSIPGAGAGPVPPPIADLDALPLPDKALFEDVVSYRMQYRTVASRGCPFACSYCCHSLPSDKGRPPSGGAGGGEGARHPAVRRMSVDRVMAEIDAAQRRYRPRRVHFDDEVFTSDRQWTRTFCSAWARRLPFSCVTHPAFMDAETATMLREAGCVMVELGVQSLDPEIRRELLHRRESNEQIERALDACHAAGLVAQVDHILDLPGDDSDLDAARFYARYGGGLRVALFHLTYYPRTAITVLAHERGWLDEADIDDIEEGRQGSIYYDSSEEARQLQALFRLMPLAPGLGRRLLDSGRWRQLGRLPWVSNVALEAATAAVNRDPRALAYAGFYVKHLAARAR